MAETNNHQNYQSINADQNGNDTSCCEPRWSALFAYIFFDWPWEMVQMMNSTDHEAENHQNLSIHWLIGKCIFKSLHVFLIIIGAFSQLIICFSRLNPYSHWVQESNMSINTNSTPYCQLECNIDKHFITAFIFPDAIIVLMSLWKLFVELLDCPCWSRHCQCLKDCLNINTDLNMLVEESQLPIETKYKKCLFYILLSLCVSISYVFAFGIHKADIQLQLPITSSNININNTWRWLGIVGSIFGFLAIDLLYIQVITWYAYQCYILISYLNSINIFPNQNQNQEQQNQNQITFNHNHKKKIENIVTFLRQLNNSSAAIGIVIIIAGFSAISCVINLLNTTDCPMNNEAIMQLWQVVVVTLRLLLWTFITLFPFYKAAKVNATLREFSFKLAMYVHSPEAEKVSKGLKYFSPEARLLGILVQPWLPIAIVLTSFFTIMLGSSIVGYFHLL